MSDIHKAAGRICQFINMLEADAEINGQVYANDVVILSFMGSGASDQLTIGDFRALRNALPVSEGETR